MSDEPPGKRAKRAKRQNHALRESNELFRTMANSAPVMIWMAGPDARSTFFNHQWLEFTGRSMEQETGDGWTQGVHPEDQVRYRDAYASAFAAKKKLEVEYRLRRSDGEYRWVFDTGVPMHSPGGVFSGYISSCVDITDRKQTEESLRQSEDRYRDLVENSGVLFGTHDLDGTILSANRATLRLAGCTAEQMIGRKIPDFLAPGVRHLFDSYLETVIREGQARGLMKVSTPGGKELVLDYANSLRREHLDRPIVRCIGTDVTERRRGQLALRESEERFRRLAESMRDIVWIVSADGRNVLFLNSAFQKVTGHTPESLHGRESTVELIHPEDREQAVAGITRQVCEGHDVDVEFRIVRPDGSFRWVRTRAFPIRNEHGEVQRLAGVTEDITERKQFEQAMREKNFELERVILARDRFLASMSHELRTPLNAIIGFTGTLLMKLPGPLTEQQSKQLQTIRSSARHLLSLINDLLDLAKIESGRVALTIEPVVVQSVGEEVSSTLRPLAEKKGLELNLTVPEDQVVVNTDRRALSQILLNLTSNAIKFTEEGEVRIVLSRDYYDGKSWTQLSVHDTGVGIRPEDQPKLFQAFSQVERNVRRSEGTGLGLYLSQKLATLLGGQINFKSEYGKGTIFTLSLPEN